MRKIRVESAANAPQSTTATVPLFRPEVMTARQEQAAGALLLVQPISTTLLTGAAVAIAVGLVLLSFRGEYTRKARVAGYLVPTQGLIKIYSRETGTIVEKNRSDRDGRAAAADRCQTGRARQARGGAHDAGAPNRQRRGDLPHVQGADGSLSRIKRTDGREAERRSGTTGQARRPPARSNWRAARPRDAPDGVRRFGA